VDAVTVISTNLLRLRKARNLTQETVAEAAGFSRSAYRNLEKGQAEPRSETLRALADALGVPLRELVSPVRRLEHVRFRSLKRFKRRDQVLAEVGRWLQDFEELEALLDAKKPHSLSELSAASGLDQVAARGRTVFL
jgi:transcriptional regulator with XRE-family HTH domain